MQPKIADYYVPPIFSEMLAIANTTGWASANWPSANLALFLPVIFPYPCTLVGMNWGSNAATGNYDIGLYDGYTKKKLASSGSVAVSSTGIKTLTFPSLIRVDPGKLYYAALVKSTTGAAIRVATEIQACVAIGAAQQASALPLPDPFVPAAPAQAYLPLFSFNVL